MGRLQHLHTRKNQSKLTEIENFCWEGNKHILVNKIAFWQSTESNKMEAELTLLERIQ